MTACPIEPVYIDDRELARRTGLARVTLQVWRTRAEGPPFYRLGRRCVYDWNEVQTWIRAHRVGGAANAAAR